MIGHDPLAPENLEFNQKQTHIDVWNWKSPNFFRGKEEQTKNGSGGFQNTRCKSFSTFLVHIYKERGGSASILFFTWLNTSALRLLRYISPDNRPGAAAAVPFFIFTRDAASAWIGVARRYQTVRKKKKKEKKKREEHVKRDGEKYIQEATHKEMGDVQWPHQTADPPSLFFNSFKRKRRGKVSSCIRKKNNKKK